MPLCHRASILLPLLIACGVVAQEAQHFPADSRESRIYRIYLRSVSSWATRPPGGNT